VGVLRIDLVRTGVPPKMETLLPRLDLGRGVGRAFSESEDLEDLASSFSTTFFFDGLTRAGEVVLSLAGGVGSDFLRGVGVADQNPHPDVP
jgi:hypothetical protein